MNQYYRLFSFTLVKVIAVISALAVMPSAFADAGKFYANEAMQAKSPKAYALSELNQAWLKQAHHIRSQDAKRFFNALKQESQLFASLIDWPNLSFEQRMSLLPKVFAIECQVLQMVCPELVINNSLYPTRAVNFVFDIKAPGSGLVYLNPDKLKAMETYAPLAFLIHETRHAYQFQLAFNEETLLAQGYREAFTTQAQQAGFSFSDFLTLLNEYEAFQFGNQMIGLLVNWQVDMPNMGTFASQFDAQGKLKIDLLQLAKVNSTMSLLEAYNQKAKAQYILRAKEN